MDIKRSPRICHNHNLKHHPRYKMPSCHPNVCCFKNWSLLSHCSIVFQIQGTQNFIAHIDDPLFYTFIIQYAFYALFLVVGLTYFQIFTHWTRNTERRHNCFILIRLAVVCFLHRFASIFTREMFKQKRKSKRSEYSPKHCNFARCYRLYMKYGVHCGMKSRSTRAQSAPTESAIRVHLSSLPFSFRR